MLCGDSRPRLSVKRRSTGLLRSVRLIDNLHCSLSRRSRDCALIFDMQSGRISSQFSAPSSQMFSLGVLPRTENKELRAKRRDFLVFRLAFFAAIFWASTVVGFAQQPAPPEAPSTTHLQ